MTRTTERAKGSDPLRKALAFALCCLMGGLVDRCALGILPGSAISFGMSFALVAASRLGPLLGLLAVFPVKAAFLSELGIYYAFAAYGLDALTVGLVRRRRPDASILAIDGIFWPLLGLPILGASYHFLLGVSPETIRITLLKLWLASLLNAHLADLVSTSTALDWILGSAPPPCMGLRRYVQRHASSFLIPLALLGLFATATTLRFQMEKRLASRITGGLDMARLALAAEGAKAGPEELVAALMEFRLDPDGRYAILNPGEDLAGLGFLPWREGLVVRSPERWPHPTDRWRASEYAGLVEGPGLRLCYILPFERSFRTICDLYAVVLAVCLGCAYAAYIAIASAALALSRRTGSLVTSVLDLRERIEAGEKPSWPRLDIAELSTLSQAFEAVSSGFISLFGELRASRDGLEAAVAARTAELESRSEEVRLLLARVEGEREAERIRVARELHDELGQGLAGLGLSLHLLERQFRDPEGRAGERIEEMRGILAGLSRDTRRIVADLRPAVLDRLGLSEALARLAEESSLRSGIRIEYSAQVPPDLAIPEELRTAAYRVAQEALTNVIRHAGAGLARLSLGTEEGRLVLEVSDDGTGFLPAAGGVGPPPSFGLLGMRERCLSRGGEFRVVSMPGRGCLVRAAFPLAHPHCQSAQIQR